jgi:hypothetical protein
MVTDDLFGSAWNEYLTRALHVMQVIEARMCRSGKPTSEARSKLCGCLD